MVRIETELGLFKEDIVGMSDKVRKMFVLAQQVLETGNKETALSIIDMDEYVNNDNEEVNDKAIEVLSLLAPVASDLRIVMAGIKISTDLERIGDYAKNIAKYVIKNEAVDSSILPYVQQIHEKFIQFFDEAMEAYKKQDAKKAMELPTKDDAIDAAFKKMINHINQDLEAGAPIKNLVSTVGMLRNFERAGDHTKNICEHIIYEVKGQHYDFG